MTDKSETPKILEEISQAGAKGSGRLRNQKNARRRLFVVTLLLVPLMTTIPYLGFQLRELRKEIADTNAQYDGLRVTVSDQNTRIQELSSELEQYAGAELADLTLVEDLRRMNSEIEELRSQGLVQLTAPDSYWNLREAEFLLNLANRKLILEKDIPSSIELIEDVDSSIVASGHQNVVPLRGSLSRALSNLRAFGRIDEEGIFVQIESLKAAVDEIKVRGLKNPNSTAEGVITDFEDVGYSTKGINSLLSFLSNIFVWREWDQTSDLILRADERAIAKQRLYLLLEQAQHGLISQNGVVYKQSLIGGKELFAVLAIKNFAFGGGLSAELDSLIAINIDPELPLLDEPLRLMNQQIYRLREMK